LCLRTKKVPCTAAAAGAPWTSFVAAVDEVARTPPGRISRIFVLDIRERPPLSGKNPGNGFPGQIPALPGATRAATPGRHSRAHPGGIREHTPTGATRAPPRGNQRWVCRAKREIAFFARDGGGEQPDCGATVSCAKCRAPDAKHGRVPYACRPARRAVRRDATRPPRAGEP
jgi:hypothetical protein